MTTPTKPTDPPAAAEKPKGRIVRNAFAVALSDACAVFDAAPPEHREMLLQNLAVLYGPKPNAGA